MTLPLTLPLGIKDLEAEFLAPAATPFTDFLRDGPWVPTNTDNAGIPTELPLAMTDFFGASRTIPVVESIGPGVGTDINMVEINGGIYITGDHLNLVPTVETDEKFVIDVTLRINADHIDGDDEPPQMSGYSWARQRARVILGPSKFGSNSATGVAVDFYFTSATTGYISIQTIDTGFAGRYLTTSAGRWQDLGNTEYGNFVIPNGDSAVRIRLTRGESVTTREFSGTAYYFLDYNLYIYQREEFTNLWRAMEMRFTAPSNQFGGTEFNQGGTLSVGNNVYENNALATLKVERAEAAIGVFEIP